METNPAPTTKELESALLFAYGALLTYEAYVTEGNEWWERKNPELGPLPEHVLGVLAKEIKPVAKRLMNERNAHEDSGA